jgi:hypothetical protein
MKKGIKKPEYEDIKEKNKVLHQPPPSRVGLGHSSWTNILTKLKEILKGSDDGV